jgi:hypothetical protein
LAHILLAIAVAANDAFQLNHEMTLRAGLEAGRYRVVVSDGSDRHQTQVIEVRSELP